MADLAVRGVGDIDAARQDGLGRRHHHRHVAPFLHRALLDHAQLGELFGETIEDRRAALGVGHLPAAEHDRHLDLVLVAQEALDVDLLGVVVVLGDLRTELDLADRDLLLVLARLLLLLRLFVLVLRVVEHAAHRRLGLGCHLDEIEVALSGIAQRVVDLHQADLLAVLADEADLWNPDALVDPGRITLWRPPVESTRDRHYRSRARVTRSACAGWWVVRWPRGASIAGRESLGEQVQAERLVVSSRSRATKSASATTPASPALRSRTATVPAAASR